MRIEFTEAEVTAALVDYLKNNRPTIYASVKGKDAVLYCEVEDDELIAAGFEVDDWCPAAEAT